MTGNTPSKHKESLRPIRLPAGKLPRACISQLGEKLGTEILVLSPEEVRVSMPVEGNRQLAGALHGGATATLCETAASLAANERAHEGESPRIAVGTNLTITHLRPVFGGRIVATAKAVLLGRNTTVHSVEVVDEAGRLIATALVTNQLLDATSD